MKKIIVILIIIGVVLIGCIFENQEEVDPFDKALKDESSKEATNETKQKLVENDDANETSVFDPNDKSYLYDDTSNIGFKENNRIYSYEEKDDVLYIYITIFEPDDMNKYTFNDVNSDIDFNDNEKPTVNVICQLGDQKGPRVGNLGFGLTDSNATLSIRGHSTREAKQKSYKVELNKNAGLIYGQNVLNLNKHYYDNTRLRNKLGLDMLQGLDSIPGVRTTFVNLFIKDLSQDTPKNEFIDMGLYTHVEQINEDYLKNRNMDWKGNLYKAEFFEFYRYEDELMKTDDPMYDKDIFESILEIKDGKKHDRLLRMLDDLNDESLNINDVFSYYFDEDNYLTWLASNILIGNRDTNSQNFYLYRPGSTDKWFFIPWDYDGAWGFYSQAGGEFVTSDWQKGISNYWGDTLHRRFFMEEGNIELLKSKIDELVQYFSRENISSYIDIYKPLIWEYISKKPDNRFEPNNIGSFNAEIDNIIRTVDKNKKIFYENIEKPMPVYLWYNGIIDGLPSIGWGESFDFQGDEIKYEIIISDNKDFENPIYYNINVEEKEISIDNAVNGTYYAKLILKDEKGNTINSFPTLINGDGSKIFGTIEFIIDLIED